MTTQVFNPLKFWCPPNGATPDYIAYHDFESWIAFGLMACWLSHDADDPNADCSMSRPVTRDDVRELRNHFLDLVETVIVSLWKGQHKPGDGEIDGDWQHVYIDAGEDDSDPTILTWHPRLDGGEDGAMMFELDCTGADSTAIWLHYDAIEDRANVLQVLRKARETIGDKVWDELEKLVSQPV